MEQCKKTLKKIKAAKILGIISICLASIVIVWCIVCIFFMIFGSRSAAEFWAFFLGSTMLFIGIPLDVLGIILATVGLALINRNHELRGIRKINWVGLALSLTPIIIILVIVLFASLYSLRY